MANDTLSKLVKAKIVEVNPDSNPKYMEIPGGIALPCMFNPYEYSISKTNTYNKYPKNEAVHPDSEFGKAGSQTLSLSLFFDTYEDGLDVREHTDVLWKFMAPKEEERAGKIVKTEPPLLAFVWGSFYFVAKLTSMTQRFILFKHDGTPVRARVEVTFTQDEDIRDHPPQNPTSGGGAITQVWKVTAGDRLDTIAFEIFQDATRWRSIAEYNQIRNPLVLKPGQLLRIPLNSG